MVNNNRDKLPKSTTNTNTLFTGTKNSEIEYSLLGDFSRNFTIDPTTGVIRITQPMDFEELHGSPEETERLLHLAVRARDWGTPSLYSDVPLFIYVEDENDNAPIFEEIYYNMSISENVLGGTSILKVNINQLKTSVLTTVI